MEDVVVPSRFEKLVVEGEQAARTALDDRGIAKPRNVGEIVDEDERILAEDGRLSTLVNNDGRARLRIEGIKIQWNDGSHDCARQRSRDTGQADENAAAARAKDEADT